MLTLKDWIYDEKKHFETDYQNEEEVKKYDERMSKFRDFNKEAEDIIEKLAIEKDNSIIEYGTGTGEIAINLSDKCQRITAIDVSKAMIDYAEQKAKKNNINNITFVNAGFLNYENDDTFDYAISQLALHHLPDFWKMVALKNIQNSLSDGGKLFLKDVVFPIKIDKFEKSINFTLDDFFKAAGEESGKNFINHIKNEYSTFDWIMEEMFYRCGFDLIDASYDDFYIASYVCKKR